MVAVVSWCRAHFGRERCQCDHVVGRSGTAHGGACALGGMGGRGRSRGTFGGHGAAADGHDTAADGGAGGATIALVAPTVVGATQPVMTPLTQVEVAAAMTDGS